MKQVHHAGSVSTGNVCGCELRGGKLVALQPQGSLSGSRANGLESTTSLCLSFPICVTRTVTPVLRKAVRGAGVLSLAQVENSVTVKEGAKKKKKKRAGFSVLEGNKPVGEREGFLLYHLLKHDSCWAGIQLFLKDHHQLTAQGASARSRLRAPPIRRCGGRNSVLRRVLHSWGGGESGLFSVLSPTQRWRLLQGFRAPRAARVSGGCSTARWPRLLQPRVTPVPG